VEEFYVKNPSLYASTIQKSLWIEGERTARAISRILKEKIPGRQLNLLDVPCGMGRVAIPLAKLGINVTGLDISPEYVRIAREKAIESGVQSRTTFIVGRAEKLEKILMKNHSQMKFDAAINMHTNLGYGTIRDDEAFLRATRSVLRRGGLFVITAWRNKENITRHLEETSFQETDQMIVLQNNRYVESKSRLYTIWRFYRKNVGRGRRSEKSVKSLVQIGNLHTDVRVYSTLELAKLLEKTGWKVLEYGESLQQRKKPISETSTGVYFLSTPA